MARGKLSNEDKMLIATFHGRLQKVQTFNRRTR